MRRGYLRAMRLRNTLRAVPTALCVAFLAVALGLAGDPASVLPVPRTDAGALARQALVLQRVREAKGPAPVVFIGASIIQRWEEAGREPWDRLFVPMGAVNLGSSGDRTENVLWRLQQAPLTPLAPKVIVVQIGTNNLGRGAGAAAETLLGIRTVLAVLREQCPQAKVVLAALFPRGTHLNAARGEGLQVNQALAADPGEDVTFLDIGERFIDAQGDLRTDLMADELHPSPAGYALWAGSLEPIVRARLEGR
jgi:lysophospholipase L1-like esterase